MARQGKVGQVLNTFPDVDVWQSSLKLFICQINTYKTLESACLSECISYIRVCSSRLMMHLKTQLSSSSFSVTRAAGSIQRIRTEPSINDPKPPPYQYKGTVGCVSRSCAQREARRGSSPQHCPISHCSSEASVEQDTESYLNKGCEEDIPSDSTAVVGPEVRFHLLDYQPRLF